MDNDTKKFTLIWDRPEITNGPIKNYVLNGICNSVVCYNETLKGENMKHIMNTTLKLNQFQLHAENSPTLR